jgi:hypothetical protein
MKTKILGVGVLILASAGMIWAQETHYLDPGTNVISDKLAEGSVYEGDILELAEGTFIEEDTVYTPFALTIRGADGATVKWYVADSIDALYAGGDITLENIIFETDTTTAWTFEVDTLVGTSNSNVAIQGRVDGMDIKIDHCQFIGFGVGIGADGDYPLSEVTLDSVVIANTLFYGGPRFKTYRALHLDYGFTQVLDVHNCTFWRIESECLKVYGSDEAGQEEYFHAMVDHNTFVDIGFPGLEQYGIHFKNDPTEDPVGFYIKYTSDDDTLRNNIFYDVADFAIKLRDGLFMDTYMDYNTCDSSGWGCDQCCCWHYSHGDLGFPNNLTGNGILNMVDPGSGNFTLGTGSVAIGAAHDGTDQGSSITVWKPGTWDHTASVDDAEPVPAFFALRQNYPNPFNPSTTVSYSLPEGEMVTLDIYNILGHKVRTLVSENKSAGNFTAVWDGLDDRGNQMPNGVYFYRLQAGAFLETRKMVLLK